MARPIALWLLAASLGFAPGRTPPLAAGAPRSGLPSWEDLYGDPVPPDARARFGTSRFRFSGYAFSLGFTPDGRRAVASGSLAQVWDMATGKPIRAFPAMAHGMSPAASLSPDGKRIAVASVGSKTRGVFDVA